jgi:hypothetical protein
MSVEPGGKLQGSEAVLATAERLVGFIRLSGSAWGMDSFHQESSRPITNGCDANAHILEYSVHHGVSDS